MAEHWNGKTWSLVPSPSPGAADRILTSVSAMSATSAWAVGTTFGTARETTLIEHWNGRTWSVVPSPNPGPDGADVLRAVMATSAGNAWAAGQFCVPPGEIGCTGPGRFSHAVILHWNGKTWSSIASPAVPGPRLP